jgi:ribulose-phosphate 3-epimerase
MALIAPSLFSADFARLGEALGAVKAAGATMIHLDVADGHFVPGITAGQPVIKSIRRATDLVLDVHLLIERPERYVADFVAAGADRISVHPESTTDLLRVLEMIRATGAKAGAALNPGTPVEAIADVMEHVDFLTIVTADVSQKEQSFISGSFDKIRLAARRRDERRLKFAIQVEGGLTFERVESVIRAGADILVAGSHIFDKESPKARLADWIQLAAATTETQRV